MPEIVIRHDSKKQLSENFQEREFYSKSTTAPSSHGIDSRLVDVAQYVRDIAGPTRITSSVRFPGGDEYSANSQHSESNRKALDLGWGALLGTERGGQIAEVFHKEILNRGPVFQKLFSLGVRGFGLYDHFIHLDVRTNGVGKSQYNGIPFAFWDFRTNPVSYEEVDIENPPSGEIVILGGGAPVKRKTDFFQSFLNLFKRTIRSYEDEEDMAFTNKPIHYVAAIGTVIGIVALIGYAAITLNKRNK